MAGKPQEKPGKPMVSQGCNTEADIEEEIKGRRISWADPEVYRDSFKRGL